MSTKAEEFMAAMRGIPAADVAAALGQQTPGIVWTGCGKKHMARRFEGVHAQAGPGMDRDLLKLLTVNIQTVARRAKARADGLALWASA